MPGIDGRSAASRRFRDLIYSISSDLGGFDGLAEADRALVRQAACLTIEAERMQVASTRGDAIDHDSLVRLSNTLRRIQAGLRARVPRKVETGLAGYFERKKAS